MSSQWRYFTMRVLLMIPVLFLVMTMVFLILRLGPLDPVAAILGPQGTGASAADIRQRLGLNDPLWQQYLDFMWTLISFDLGQSWVIQSGLSTRELVAARAPRTIWLGLWSIMLPLFVGVPLGFYAGLNSNSLSDYFASFMGIVWQAMPNFWLGIMLLAVLRQTPPGGQFDILPNWYELGPNTESLLGTPDLTFVSIDYLTVVPIPVGFEFFEFLTAIKQIAPAAFVLGSALMVTEMRIGRTATLEQVNSNYVETAKAKGLRGRTIVWKHIFRNAMIPMLPVMFSEIGVLIGGSVIVEEVFAINGLGRLFFQAVLQNDMPLAGSLVFVFTIIALVFKILEDFLYTVIDPRVGFEGEQ
jgi:peptide/nickel transport system permease protein